MSAQTMELHPSAAETANGATGWFKVSTITMAMVTVDFTDGSGTITDFTCYLQGRDDVSGQAYDLIFDQALKTIDSATGGAERTNERDIRDGKNDTVSEANMAIYKHLPCEYVRLVWKLSGTTPSLTFTSKLVGK